jgi:hypothetical protein
MAYYVPAHSKGSLEGINSDCASAPGSVGAVHSVLSFCNDFENDGLQLVHVNLTFTRHSGAALTTIHLVRPRQLRVVLAHPSQSMAVRATAVNHAACLNSRKASIARFESISLRCSPLSIRVLIAPRRTSAVCCGSSISPEASPSDLERVFYEDRKRFCHEIKTSDGASRSYALIAFSTSAARDIKC